MPNQLFVSIISPTYNRLPNLKLVLKALEKQTIPFEEWIIADDGSTDDTKKWIREMRNPKIKYIYLGENIGYRQGKARNMGAELATKKSKAFWFLDSDVLPYPDDLKLYKEAYNENSNRVIVGMYDWGAPVKVTEYDITDNWDNLITENLPPLDNPIPHGMCGKDIRTQQFEETTPNELHWETNYGLSTFGGNILVPREIFYTPWIDKTNPDKKIYGFDDSFTVGIEDGDFGLMTLAKGFPISLHKGIKGYHVYHPRDIARIQKMSAEQIPYLDKKHGLNVEGETEIVQRDDYDIK